jgi:hypothetical protein
MTKAYELARHLIERAGAADATDDERQLAVKIIERKAEIITDRCAAALADWFMNEEPQKVRTTITRHDARGRIAEMVREDIA